MNRTLVLSQSLGIYNASLVSSWEFLSVCNTFLPEDTHRGAQRAAQNTEIQRPQPQMGPEGTSVSLETLPLSGLRSWGWFVRVGHMPTDTHWLLILPPKC